MEDNTLKFVDFIIYSQQYIIIYTIPSFDQSFDFCCSLLTTLSLISRKWIIILWQIGARLQFNWKAGAELGLSSGRES